MIRGTERLILHSFGFRTVAVREGGQSVKTVIASFLALTALMLPGCAKQLTRESLANENVPAIKKDCSVCHATPDVPGKAAALRKPVQELCIQCHADRVAPSEHRTGVVQQAPVKNLPLLNKTVTCITCHDPHRGAYRKMLRAQPKDLCLYCHDK